MTQILFTSRTSAQNILSPPSHNGGIFDKGEDVFWGKIRAEGELQIHYFYGKR
jgi:hypothetical protein